MPVQHTRIPFAHLVFLDDNPRTRTPEGLQQMAADIEADPTFFENRPVLVNLSEGRHQVYAGDLRAHAAHDVLGWPDIPCIVERDVPPEVMRRRAIIDNLHRETWAPDILTTSWASDDLAGWGLTPDKWADDGEALDPETLTDGFSLPDGDRAPFQQMTFTLADDQARIIQEAIADMKQTDDFKYAETYGNENSNGNALYLIVQKWEGLKTSF